jgi:hypothetical protein
MLCMCGACMCACYIYDNRYRYLRRVATRPGSPSTDAAAKSSSTVIGGFVLSKRKNKTKKQLKKNKRRSPLHKTNNLYIQRTYYYSPTAHHDQTLALPYQWWDCPNPTRKTAWWNCVQIMSLIDWECFDIDGTTSVSPGRCCCWLVVVCARRVAWLWVDTVLAYACVFFLYCARVVCFVCFCVGCCALRCEVRFSLG